MNRSLFSFQGRISRASFWKGIALVIAADVAAGVVSSLVRGAAQVPGGDGTPHLGGAAAIGLALLATAVAIFTTWAGLSLTVKRFHDRDKSGWWVLIQLVPVVGAVWAFVETGCLAGTAGQNRFGSDPLAQRRVAFA